MRRHLKLAASAAVLSFMLTSVARADMEAANKYIDTEFKQSTLTKEQKQAQMKWFVDASKPLVGTTVKVLSDSIPVHKYDSTVLAKAFFDITGIKVEHEASDEATVVERIQTQTLTGENIYDMYINDSDLIGMHFRNNAVVNLTKYMAEEGKDVTDPMLDLNDFMGIDFVKDPSGDVYQLPAEEFANLYWFREDWFERPELKAKFKAKYGYELGVPQNWSAYEDIADFFTNDVKEIDGQKVYGHMDYGKKDPSLGWRFTDSWLSMAGEGSKGVPWGLPVDDWGIRMEGCTPVGASVTRGGGTNSPPAVYALQKYIDWMHKYAPPESLSMNFYEAGSVPNQGHIAQQIFWYTLFADSAAQPGLPVVDEKGLPKWRMAPSPVGPYWEEGMKVGYQDMASFTVMTSTTAAKKKAAWLYAQFVDSKTAGLARTLHGLTPVRQSDVDSQVMTDLAPRLGGLVEFYRSPLKKLWTPTGPNVPDYAKMSQLWWENISSAIVGEKTSQEAMNDLAKQMDKVMEREQRAGIARCTPKLNEERTADYWLSQPGGKPRLPNEKPQGVTVPYADLVKAWKEGRVR